MYLLLARRGVRVLVLEKHADFLRDFRGDTIHPANLEIMDDLGRLDEIDSWEKVHLLTVEANRLRRWHRPGVLCIGDAAHAMSPVGGVGINLAIHDAVVAANLLAEPLRSGRITEADLAAVERRRRLPTQIIQLFQAQAQRLLLRPALQGTPPRALGVLRRLPLLGDAVARLVALGVRRAHVQG